MHKKPLWIAVLLAVLVLCHTSASAGPAPSATYEASNGLGVVSVHAMPGSLFVVYGPRAFGLYGPCATGFVGPSGSVDVVASYAPGFGSIIGVHLTVEVIGPGGGIVQIDEPMQEWWLD